jgi:integration host factor subunit alpha
MTLTKADLVEKISLNGLSRKQSPEVMEALLETIKHTLESGEDVMISGFGKFCVKEKSRRRGRNPATGEELYLDARRVVTFQCSGVLKDKINEES